MKLLEQINSPSDLKKLSIKELNAYAEEVRSYIIETVRRQGGHLASNLGTVELITALHYVFDCPVDKLLFDVGHQAYTHKIITGRRDSFYNLRSDEGVSGFPNASESTYDAFTMGHSSTSLSLGVGFARARDILGLDYNVVCVIGDGAFTGGMAFEALNDIGANKEKMIIVLNDNKMSISKNVGALNEYLAKLRLSKRYLNVKYNVKKAVSALPFFGDRVVNFLDKTKDNIKKTLLPDKIFENLGVKYYGPFDGHNIAELVSILKKLKEEKGPVLLHVLTNKGNGVPEILHNPDKYHGVGPENKPETEISYSSVVGNKLCALAQDNKSVVAVTAAMSMGTGLDEFARRFPDRYFDVGIAEGHAASMCAALAAAGVKPFFAVYSSFLQRAFDQVLHDICIDKRPVTLLIDHAGAVGGDGITHQGNFDIGFLSVIPDMTILQPKDGKELESMMDFALKFNAPLAIRYPKSFSYEFDDHNPIEGLKWETLVRSREKIFILAAGNRMIKVALGVKNANVVNVRVIKPLDKSFLSSVSDGSLVITLEDGMLKGGFGESVESFFNASDKKVKVVCLGYPDKFQSRSLVSDMMREAGITEQNISEIIVKFKKA